MLDTTLKAPWRADADQVPHQQAKVAAGDVYDQLLQDVRMPSKVNPPHPAGLAHVRKRPLRQLPSISQ